MKLRKLPIPYIYCILIGILLGLLLGTRFYWSHLLWGAEEPFNWERYFASPFINQAWWGVLVPLVFYCYNKFDWHLHRWKAIGASILVALFHEITSYFAWGIPMDLLGYEEFSMKNIPYILRSVPTGFISQWIQYWIIWGIFFGIDYAKRYKHKEVELAKIEGQLSNAQLNALRLQLQPHFLFNTLNTISSLMEFNIKDAQKIVSKLGVLLRTILDEKRGNRVPLHEELAFIRSYLDIEQVRFHDRLEVQYDIEEEIAQVEVPNLILQPLVENAIKHGFANHSEAGIILLSAKRLGEEKIELIVKDNGSGTDEFSQNLVAKGIGLKNVKERLELMYQTNQEFIIQTAKGKGFEVIIRLPS